MFENLEAEQKKCGYTNKQMAKLLNISPVAYENRKKSGMFTLGQIILLLELFNCKFEYLFQTDICNKSDQCNINCTYLQNTMA